jgi:hypothetical protein
MELAAIPVLDGSVGVTGIAIRHLDQAVGLILPCLMPERPFVPDSRGSTYRVLAPRTARKEGSWKTFWLQAGRLFSRVGVSLRATRENKAT